MAEVRWPHLAVCGLSFGHCNGGAFWFVSGQPALSRSEPSQSDFVTGTGDRGNPGLDLVGRADECATNHGRRGCLGRSGVIASRESLASSVQTHWLKVA